MGLEEAGRKQMTSHRITLLGSQDEDLREWLNGDHAGNERAAIVLFRRLARTVQGQTISDRFLAVEIIKMSGNWIIGSSATHLQINMREFPEIYHRCESENLELGFVHNHPGSVDSDFSSVDDINERNILHGLSGCNGNKSFCCHDIE